MTARQLSADRSTITARSFVMRRPTLVAAAVCVLSLSCFWIAQRAANVSMIDLMVYRAEGWTVRSGEDLYAMRATDANLPTTYPPFAAILFVPLTWLGVDEMRTAATVGNLALLGVLVHLSLRLVGRPISVPRPAAALAVTAVAAWCEPVWTTLRYGQINLLLAVLVLWDLTRRADHRWAGMGIGIAAGIKLTPALFAVFLALVGSVHAWRRLRGRDGAWNHWLRRAAVAVGAFTGTAVLAAIALPYDSRRFWTEMVFESGRAGHGEDTANQSLRGIIARLLHTGDPGLWWVVAAAVAVAAGLGIAVAAGIAGPRLPAAPAWAAVSCSATALLISPVSWSHHWVWCVPAVLLVASEAMRRRSRAWWASAAGGALLFSSYLLWLVPHGPGRRELAQTPGQMALSAAYPAAASGLLALAGFLAVRALRTQQPLPRPRLPSPAGPLSGRQHAYVRRR